jgi:hypothetical protein
VVDQGRAPNGVTLPASVARGACDRLDGGGGRLCLLALAAAGACLALSSPALAAKTLVSPQYQSKSADTTARTWRNGPAADPSGGDPPRVAAGSDPLRILPAPETAVGSEWYHFRNSRYQLRTSITPHETTGVKAISSGNTPPIRLDNTERRRLVQLGAALGFAYVLFLAFWFRWVRARTHGARRVVRY